MRKNAPFIIIFALAVLAYGLSQYWELNRSARFEAVLLDFLPQNITRIDLQKAGDEAFSIRRNEDRWVMSQANLHETVKASAVDELLKRLRSIRTATIVTDKTKEWESYGVAEDQGIKVCLHQKEDNTTCLRLGRYTYTEQEKRLSAYTRLAGQREVYAINGMAVSLLDGRPDYFRNKQLIQLNEKVVSMKWQTSDQVFELIHNNEQWVTSNEQLADSLLWDNYLQSLPTLEGHQFADDIDETTIKEQLDWRLSIYTMTDSIQLDCYFDSTRQAVFVLHSQQFPQTWLSSDSTGIYQQLSAPWLKTFIPNE
ncbi:MAG: DUF4340 domain-containing protein [Bacteroidota bacterium]